MHFELSPLVVWIVLWIENTYSEFQVNIFSNNRDIIKCYSFLHHDDNNDAKAIASSPVFSENSRAKKKKKSPHSAVGCALNLKTRKCGFDFLADQTNNY